MYVIDLGQSIDDQAIKYDDDTSVFVLGISKGGQLKVVFS